MGSSNIPSATTSAIPADVNDLIAIAGAKIWGTRVGEIRRRIGAGGHAGRLMAQRYAAECAIEKARRGQALAPAETAFVSLATRIPAVYDALCGAGQDRLGARLHAALASEATLFPLLHLLHTAGLQAARGFDVRYAGLEDGTPFDLLISRDGEAAEIACDALSAEEGHTVQRGMWTRLIDRIDPDLQTWLAAHPGRYILKMTLPNGLKAPGEAELPALQTRIRDLLAGAKRADYDEAAMLRLDPLLLAGAQASDTPAAAGVMAKLRREFGPEAHLAMISAGSSVFITAARGAHENAVAAAMRDRLAAIAPARLTGTRPGIIAMLLDDASQMEWQALRQQMMLESEIRHFLTYAEAAPVIAVTCASRFEMGNTPAPVAVCDGEVRFRNPKHQAAKSVALAPAVTSTV